MSKRILILLLIISLAVVTFCTKKSTTPEEKLLPPTDLTITLVENNQIQINWIDNSTNETAYLIDRKKGTFDWLVNYSDVTANLTSFTDNISTNSDTVYAYRIRAFDGENFSAYSDTIAWFSNNSAPSSLQIEQIAQDTLKLTWQDNSTGEQYFRIDRKIDEKGWQMDYAHVPADSTHFLDYTTALYDTCNYKVFAVSGISHSDSTENAFIPFLPAPSNFQLQALGATQVKLTWQDNCHNEEGYRIYIKRELYSEWDSLNISYNSETYIDENVIPGIVNFYKISAYYENETSEFVEDNINTLIPPVIIALEQQNVHMFRIEWIDLCQYEQGFQLDRKIDEEEWISPLAIIPPNETGFIDSTVGRNYDTVYYRLFAFYETYNSYTSNINSNIAFPAPKDLEFEKLTIQSIKLTWDDYSQGETGFIIDKKVGVGIGEWQIEYAIVGENIQEWTDDVAEINETLQYRIHAYCGDNVSDYAISQEIENTFPAPTDISYQKIDIATIKLNWTDNSVGEQGFKIDKRVGDGNWEIEYAILDADIVQWFDWTAEINEKIYYRIYAYYENSTSAFGFTGEILNYIPAPTNLSHEKIDIHTIKLEWTDNSIGEQGFKIDKKVGENNWQINFATVDDNIEEWTDENAEINELIKYRVYAYFNSYLSGYATTNEIDNSLTKPTNLGRVFISTTSIELSWIDNSICEDGFKIDRKVNREEWELEYGVVNGNTIQFIDNFAGENDSLLYRVYTYYENYTSGFSNQIEVYPRINDTDSNVYEIVQIGDQWWMKDNLRVNHYRNGDSIPEVQNETDWANLNTGACCDYNNNSENGYIYGHLYNWYAVNDIRLIAIKGWHIPTDDEWKTLVDFLGGENIAGGKMKELGFIHWTQPNTGATNESLFTGLPAGYRYSGYNSFRDLHQWAYFWSSSEYNPGAWSRILSYNSSEVYRSHPTKSYGNSVRCVKD